MWGWINNLWSNESIYDHLPDDFDDNTIFDSNITDITGGTSLKDIVVDKSKQLYYLSLIIGGVYLYKILK